jgi:hypothetical protein
VYDHGTQQEDGPGTWEAQPTFLLGNFRSDGDPVTTPRRAVRWRMRARPADATRVAPRRRSIRAEVGRRQGETGAAADLATGLEPFGELRVDAVGVAIQTSKDLIV